jgi:hypothetical protein
MHSSAVQRNRRKQRASSEYPGYRALQNLLQDFASALLPRGMTPRLFGELARLAFVKAAAQRSRLRNGKVNHSRVAAQTGLSRADVKRLLGPSAASLEEEAPVQRVMNGWRKDRAFTNRSGQPKRLRILGRRPSFTHLSAKYAGDVPYRAVLDQLIEMGAVLESSGCAQLLKPSIGSKNYSFLAPLEGPFSDGLRIVCESKQTRKPSSIQRLQLPVNTSIDLAVVGNRCAESASLMLEGLRHSLTETVTLPTRKKKSAYSFTVTILLAANQDVSSSGKRGGRVARR